MDFLNHGSRNVTRLSVLVSGNAAHKRLREPRRPAGSLHTQPARHLGLIAITNGAGLCGGEIGAGGDVSFLEPHTQMLRQWMACHLL